MAPRNAHSLRTAPEYLRFQDGGGLSKEAVMAAIARQKAQSAQAPQPPAPAPAQPQDRGMAGLAGDFLRNPGAILRDREQRAGLRFQDGGVVPGSGRGDKIPAKYEPGEFVVSNDMIDDNPGLREQLAGLRAETLAARGKTVEEADAHALRYAGQLRAAVGFDPMDRMARDLTGQNSLPPRSPVGNMADDLARNARAAAPEGPTVRPTAPLSPEAAAAYDASPEGRATKAQVLKDTRGYFQGNPSAAAAPAAAPAAALATRAGQVAGGALRDAQSWVVGDRAPASTALGKAKNIGAGAMTAVGRGVGLYDTAGALGDNFQAMRRLASDDSSTLSDYAAGGVEMVGNVVANGAANLGRRFPVIGPTVAGFLGNDAASRLVEFGNPGGSVLRRHGLNGTGLLRNAFTEGTDVTTPPGQPQGQPTVQPVAQPATQPTAQPTAQPAARPTAQPQYTNDVTRNGNEYSGTNVAGDITVNGFAPGAGLGRGNIISPQNMAAADALAGRDNLRSMGAAQASAAQMPMAQAPTALHSGNSWQARNDLRNLEVSASSIANQRGMVTNDRGRVINPGVGDNGAREAYQAALKQDLAMRSAQPGLDLEMAKSNNSLRSDIFKAQTGADVGRYAADQGLRGDMFKAAATERTARAAAAAAAQKQASDDAIRQNKLDIENADRTRDRFSVYVDGKRDEAATNRAILALDKIAPGFSRMSEDARGKALPQADALFNIYNRTRSGREMGLGQTVFGNTNPQNDSLPNFKGGKLLRQGLAGVLPGQAGKDGYYVRMPDGREVQLGTGLSENELKLIRRNIETGSWKD